MNILYIAHYAGSPEMGMEFRPYYFAKEWQKLGHKVRILAANYSHLRRKNPDVSYDYEITKIDDIEYQWFMTSTYQGNGVKRALTMISFVHKLKKGAKRIVSDFSPDVVISSSTYPLDCYAGIKIAKVARCKYVHETHDIWPLTLTEIGGLSKYNPFVVMLAIAEKKAYRAADDIVCVLPFTNEHIKELGIDADNKCTYIPNGICLGDWNGNQELPEEHKRLFEKLHAEEKFIIGYAGGFALSNYLDILVDAAIKTKDINKLAFVLVGDGIEKERLKKRCIDAKLSNVHFMAPVNKKCIPNVLKESDALFVAAAKSPLYRFGVSMNKVYDYMMAAKPILYGVSAKNNDVLDAKCGLFFDPDNCDSLVEDIKALLKLPKDQLKEMGSNGKKWVLENCEYEHLSKEFLEILMRGN